LIFTKRQKAFVEFYSNPASETFGNADKSSLKARLSNTVGCKLLKKPHIIEAIAKRGQELERVTEWDRAKKAQIAKENFLEAKQPRDKMFWWQELCKLDGDYIQKTETTLSVTDKRKEELEDARKQVNQRLSTLN